MVVRAEYARLDDVVYWLNNELSTAWVQNILSTSSSVTIPSYVYYRGVQYEVVGFEKNDFNTNARNTYNISSAFLGDGLITSIATLSAIEKEEMERPFRYDYDYYRAGITNLNLPNTLLTIGKGAFDGMRSLRSITIPASVTNLPNHVFTDYLPNLQSVVILGIPTVIDDDEIPISSTDKDGNLNYFKLVKEAFNLDYCRNIKTFIMPEYEKRIPIIRAFYKANADLENKARTYNLRLGGELTILVPALKDEACINIQAVQEAYKEANSYLKTMFNNYSRYKLLYDSLTNQLKQHAYYDGSRLPYFTIELDTKEPQILSIAALEKKNEDSLKKAYDKLIGGKMEHSMLVNQTEKYLDIYIQQHPEKKTEIEKFFKEYMCEDKTTQYAYYVQYMEYGRVYGSSCRDKNWEKYQQYFDSRSEFEESYNRAPSDFALRTEIGIRKSSLEKFESLKRYVPSHKKEIKLCNMHKKINEANVVVVACLNYTKSHYYYDKVVSYLIQTLPKAQKEYEKNGRYFNSEIDFFEAYTSDSYNKNLNETKKK